MARAPGVGGVAITSLTSGTGWLVAARTDPDGRGTGGGAAWPSVGPTTVDTTRSTATARTTAPRESSSGCNRDAPGLRLTTTPPGPRGSTPSGGTGEVEHRDAAVQEVRGVTLTPVGGHRDT